MDQAGKDNLAESPDALLERHTALAYGIAKRYASRGLPVEDLRQEALLGLLDAAQNYDSAQGASFATYASFWIKKRLLLALEREGKSGGDLSATADPELIPDASPLPGQDYNFSIGQDHCPEGPNALPDDILSLPDGLPDRERAILEACYLRRLPLKQVAAELGIRVERVKQLRAKALRRIRTSLGRSPSS